MYTYVFVCLGARTAIALDALGPKSGRERAMRVLVFYIITTLLSYLIILLQHVTLWNDKNGE